MSRVTASKKILKDGLGMSKKADLANWNTEDGIIPGHIYGR